MRQRRGCAEGVVIAKFKGKKSVERRSLFMFFTPVEIETSSSRKDRCESDLLTTAGGYRKLYMKGFLASPR
jgi:hypothetical protein